MSDDKTKNTEEARLNEDDLDSVAGGIDFESAVDAINEVYTDIKKGISDAWND